MNWLSRKITDGFSTKLEVEASSLPELDVAHHRECNSPAAIRRWVEGLVGKGVFCVAKGCMGLLPAVQSDSPVCCIDRPQIGVLNAKSPIGLVSKVAVSGVEVDRLLSFHEIIFKVVFGSKRCEAKASSRKIPVGADGDHGHGTGFSCKDVVKPVVNRIVGEWIEEVDQGLFLELFRGEVAFGVGFVEGFDVIDDVMTLFIDVGGVVSVEGEVLLGVEVECALVGVEGAPLQPLEFEAIG